MPHTAHVYFGDFALAYCASAALCTLIDSITDESISVSILCPLFTLAMGECQISIVITFIEFVYVAVGILMLHTMHGMLL